VKYTNNSLQQYKSKWVNIKTSDSYHYNERVINIHDDQIVTEYHHWLKTPEDGLLREHWITISSIESIQAV